MILCLYVWMFVAHPLMFQGYSRDFQHNMSMSEMLYSFYTVELNMKLSFMVEMCNQDLQLRYCYNPKYNN